MACDPNRQASVTRHRVNPSIMRNGQMILSSYDWENDTWTHNGDNPTRQIWRDAVAEIAEKAKTTLPECNGRVDRAVKLVLVGDCELLPDGTAKVASQSHGTTKYFIVNGVCPCKDYPKAPSNWCVHRIAAGLAKRASALTKQRLEQLDAATNGTTTPAPEQATTEAPVATPVPETVATPILPLPEAPASVNFHTTIAGRQIQITLRDIDETRLLARLEMLLQRFPVVEDPKEPA